MISPIQPGQLDRLITLQSPTHSVDSVGQPSSAYSTAGTVWAKIEQTGAEEPRDGVDVTARERIKVTIRYVSGLANTWRLVHDSRTYRIVGAPREIGRRQWQEITAEHIGVFTSA
jgi:SPP1 family predicted phage head-tail adaptor